MRSSRFLGSKPSSNVRYSTGCKTTAGGKGSKGLGLGRSKTAKRRRRILRDKNQGITKGDIRRMAHRGGVKCISGLIYGDVRLVLRIYLERVLSDTRAVIENCGRKTATT